jgi:GNAT superfamily N-acetyltransferase
MTGWLGRAIELVSTDVLVRAASSPPSPGVPLSRPEVIRLAGDDSLSRWQANIPRERWKEVVPFHRRGDSGFVASVDGRFAGWLWVSRVSHRDPWSGLRVRLAPNEAYAYALWVEPEFRPKGLARVLVVSMLMDVAADPSVDQVYGWVDKRNRQSEMLLRLLGFVDVQTVRRVHILRRIGWQVPRSDRPPFGPFSSKGNHRLPSSMASQDQTP